MQNTWMTRQVVQDLRIDLSTMVEMTELSERYRYTLASLAQATRTASDQVGKA